jgi:oligo-1,6-glucosidase
MANARTWWKEAIAYQVYPRSFKDSNGDGIGDLGGITEKLDYLGELGVDVIWLSPVYRSPNADNGYDISDYREIMEDFGSSEDMARLLEAAHARGIRIVMDLVVNHTSDEHLWFRASRSRPDGPFGDYYIWAPGTDAGPPNNWSSAFGGSAWTFDEKRSEYYLHIYSEKQPDLNWNNRRVREDIYEMMRFWLDKGVDGFRMDVINQISKPESLPDDTEPAPGTRPGFRYYTNGPNVHTYLHEMNRKVLSQYDIVTVGEMHATAPEEALNYVAPERNELDMVFGFEHMVLDAGPGGKWDPKPIDLEELKRVLSRWQQVFHGRGWNSLFMNNHDYPRMVSRFGDDATYRAESAKLLAGVAYLMQGTPFLFQGEEIGMTNVAFDSIDSYRDIETLNFYRQQRAAGMPEAEIMRIIHTASRDNGRTPFQWNDGPGAGFTDATPWIPLNPNYTQINLAAQWDDEDSVVSFYRRLIAVRKESRAAVYGRFELDGVAHAPLFVYRRICETEQLTVMANLSAREVSVTSRPEDGAVALSNYPDASSAPSMLRPWELVVLRAVP